MSLNELSSRAIIGLYYKRLEQKTGMDWIEAISNYFTSDQESETYKWLGQSPVMRDCATKSCVSLNFSFITNPQTFHKKSG